MEIIEELFILEKLLFYLVNWFLPVWFLHLLPLEFEQDANVILIKGFTNSQKKTFS